MRVKQFVYCVHIWYAHIVYGVCNIYKYVHTIHIYKYVHTIRIYNMCTQFIYTICAHNSYIQYMLAVCTQHTQYVFYAHDSYIQYARTHTEHTHNMQDIVCMHIVISCACKTEHCPQKHRALDSSMKYSFHGALFINCRALFIGSFTTYRVLCVPVQLEDRALFRGHRPIFRDARLSS